MGYAVLHLEKAKGADSGMSAHIERTIHPKNADPKRTHLNRELIMFPEEVRNRTEAIQHRLNTAGLKRKIGKNQVQAIRIVLTGSHDDMKQIEQNGRLGEWCKDNIDWLRNTYGANNVVSVVLHMDEKTPHLHATIVPIVEGERRKQKKEQTVKKKYRTKAPAPRLCADEVMSRDHLILYQDTYAELMAKYGLQRGIKGSEAQHISTHEYYRSLIAQGEDLQANITQLLAKADEAKRIITDAEQARLQIIKETDEAKKDLTRIKAEAKTEELKNSATKTATAALNGINSLLGGNKISRLEQENKQLHNEVKNLNGQIERLHADMQKLKDNHASEMSRVNEQHRQEISSLKSIIEKAKKWFPFLQQYLDIERLCRSVGFNEQQSSMLMDGEPILYTGLLHSNEYKRIFLSGMSLQRFFKTAKRIFTSVLTECQLQSGSTSNFALDRNSRIG